MTSHAYITGDVNMTSAVVESSRGMVSVISVVSCEHLKKSINHVCLYNRSLLCICDQVVKPVESIANLSRGEAPVVDVSSQTHNIRKVYVQD